MVDETDFKFDEKLRQQIHFDWGKYYKRLGKNARAKKQFLDSLSLKENAHGPTEQLSKCHLERAEASEALNLASQCLKDYPKITRTNRHRNECIYDCNEFETCLVEQYRLSHDKKPVFGLVDAIKMTELTLEGSIGNQTGSFLHNFRKALSELDKIKAEDVDTRPLWKIRRDKKECDVLSICSDSSELTKKTQTIDHPLDLYRLRQRQKRARSMYFTTPTIETHDFLTRLMNDRRLHFPPDEQSANVIGNALDEELKIFEKFAKMLVQRQPIYAKKIVKRKRNSKKFNEQALLTLQDTIENHAKYQLERIRRMGGTDLSGLLAFVEEIMTNYYLLKSEKVFPKKLEFIETIYNIVGSRYVDNIQTNSDFNSLAKALSRHHGHRSVIPEKFGLSAGLQSPIDHFLKRLEHANAPVEKCHVLHQLSRLYFEQERYMESKETGEELVNIATSIDNYTWMLLGNLRVMLVNEELRDHVSLKLNIEAVRKFKDSVKGSIWGYLESRLFDDYLKKT